MKIPKKLNVPREQEEQSNPSHDHAATRLVKMAITSEISLWFSFYALSHGMIRSVFSKKHTQINAYDWLSDIVYSL